MIAEIVSNGMLTLPNAMAAVGSFAVSFLRHKPAQSPSFCQGIVPSLVLTIFLGIFALYTAKLLIDFKLNHPEVHNMGQYFDQEFQNLSLGPRSDVHIAVVIAPTPGGCSFAPLWSLWARAWG